MTEVAMTAGEVLARRFHDTYECLAPSFGYETRADTKAFDPSTPNGQLMIAVCSDVVPGFGDEGLEDDIADAISDSIDMDWTSSIGAKAVMRLLRDRRMVE